jgi:hypothetical protein
MAKDIEDKLKEAYGLIAEKIAESEAEIRFSTPPQDDLEDALPDEVPDAASEA